MIFGKQVAQRDFCNLQNGSKLLKPASMNKLLGKRSWKLEQTPNLLFNQKKIKIQKLRRSFSSDDLSPVTADEIYPKPTPQHSLQTKERIEICELEKNKRQKINQQLRISRPGLKEFANGDNIENYFAYNLGNLLSFYFLLKTEQHQKELPFLF